MFHVSRSHPHTVTGCLFTPCIVSQRAEATTFLHKQSKIIDYTVENETNYNHSCETHEESHIKIQNIIFNKFQWFVLSLLVCSIYICLCCRHHVTDML